MKLDKKLSLYYSKIVSERYKEYIVEDSSGQGVIPYRRYSP